VVFTVQQGDQLVATEQMLVGDPSDDIGGAASPPLVRVVRLVELADDKRPSGHPGEVDVAQCVAQRVEVLARGVGAAALVADTGGLHRYVDEDQDHDDQQSATPFDKLT
jgi:hypothetical protein